jgi:predicted enzyme related to lactoylglutathione lyase
MADAIQSGAVLFAKHVDHLAGFYEAIVPMRRLGADGGAIILETDMMQLVVHPIPKRIADTIEITVPPARRGDAAIKIVFAVDSLDRVRREASALGGGLNPASAVFTTRGFRACDGHDPEGNIIQFREPAT